MWTKVVLISGAVVCIVGIFLAAIPDWLFDRLFVDLPAVILSKLPREWFLKSLTAISVHMRQGTVTLWA